MGWRSSNFWNGLGWTIKDRGGLTSSPLWFGSAWRRSPRNDLSTASHQGAQNSRTPRETSSRRIDQQTLSNYSNSLFQKEQEQKLWPLSASTLRRDWLTFWKLLSCLRRGVDLNTSIFHHSDQEVPHGFCLAAKTAKWFAEGAAGLRRERWKSTCKRSSTSLSLRGYRLPQRK